MIHYLVVVIRVSYNESTYSSTSLQNNEHRVIAASVFTKRKLYVFITSFLPYWPELDWKDTEDTLRKYTGLFPGFDDR